MNDETNLAPLPPEVSSLLEDERARTEPPAEVKDRMYGRLALALGLPWGPGGPGGPGGSASSAPGTPPADPGIASGGLGVAAKAAAGAGSAAAGVAMPAAVTVAVAFAVGAVTGSVATHLLHEQGEPPAHVEARGEPAAVQPSSRGHQRRPPGAAVIHLAGADRSVETTRETTSSPGAPPLKRRPSRLPARQPSNDAASVPDPQLAAERALVERARSALIRKRPADALAAAAQHHRDFPTGRLAEEREAIRVLALTARGEHEQARKRALRFRARYPNSLLRATVDAALQARPPQTADGERPGNLR